ncbi:MAG: hypothetical protein M1834_002539 [Cirrosporium novae-zelandiae]|nr:MAG: hypothetical protein M1834_002539 [Cirrosporium novae-zelandiae]
MLPNPLAPIEMGDFMTASNMTEGQRNSSSASLSDMSTTEKTSKLKVLLASTNAIDFAITRNILGKLCTRSNLSVQAILSNSHGNWQWIQDTLRLGDPFNDNPLGPSGSCAVYQPVPEEERERKAAELSAWADLLILAPIDTNNLAKMLHGFTNNLLLEVLRGWDVFKKILMVPGMTVAAWENPMTKKQLNKIRRQWTWVRVIQPLLWQYQGEKKCVKWEGMDEVMEAVNVQADLMSIGQGVEVTMNTGGVLPHNSSRRTCQRLPPEIWSIIFDYVGDWEISKALGVYTTLPTPPEWQYPDVPLPTLHHNMFYFSWTLLTGTLEEAIAHLNSMDPPPPYLTQQPTTIILKFGLVPLLNYLSTNKQDLFRSTFSHTLLPIKASAIFPRVEILEFWRTSPFFLNKEYTSEAIDGASKAGFVNVLDWWRQSGLTLKYTAAALEGASSKGHITVLEWWKKAFTSTENPLAQKVGRSICYAAQGGQADVVRWWDLSGIAYLHEESVAKMASAHGHVNVLSAWKALKGEKMIYDNQVLVCPTKNGHSNVLEWWKRSGYRVEYKTCDIEEALEDSVAGPQEEEIRRWWAKNGLNLGVGTSEWMKVKTL